MPDTCQSKTLPIGFFRDFLPAIPKQVMEVQELLQHGLLEKRTPPQVSLCGVVEQIRAMIEAKME
jgi:hypothetical protein